MFECELMNSIDEEVRNCPKCRLSKTRKHAVPGEGSIDTKVVFIGEAPGHWENEKGRPFVGSAGELLDQMLLKIGLSRDAVYITNIVKCRPPRNRDPRPDEIESCTPYLDRQLNIIRPSFIVTLGRHSSSYILSRMGYEIAGITRARGKVYEGEPWGFRACVIPTLHPAAVLYDMTLKDYLEKDFQLLKNRLGCLGTNIKSAR